jgi:hypothetical protein
MQRTRAAKCSTEGEIMQLQGGGTALEKNEAAFCDIKRVFGRVAEAREYSCGTKMMQVSCSMTLEVQKSVARVVVRCHVA